MNKKERTKQMEASGLVSCTLRGILISPIKLNLIAKSIRKKKAGRALDELLFCQRKGGKEVRKALQSAISNAENNHGLDIDNLYIIEASVGKHMVLKRMRARAKGRGSRILKPLSSIRIILEDRVRAQ